MFNIFNLFNAFVIVLIVCLFRLYKKYWPLYCLARKYPGPPALPLIGCSHLFLGKTLDVITQRFLEYSKAYGDTYRIWYGPELNLIMHDLRDVEWVLTSRVLIDKSSKYDDFKNWLGDSLFLSRGHKWFQRRKLLTPAFHFNILDKIIPIMQKHSMILVEQLQSTAKQSAELGNESAIDLNELISLCTLDIICESAMGVSVNAQRDANSAYVQAVKIITSTLIERGYNLWHRLDCIYKYTKTAKLERKNLKILHGYTEQIIKQRRAELIKSRDVPKTNDNVKQQNDAAANDSTKRCLAFLDILLQAQIDGKPLSNLDIREEVDLFMAAGHHSITSAIIFFLYNMATYPECQRKCYAELIEICGSDKAQALTNVQLQQLPYLELCIKESLRLYPAAPMYARKVLKDCLINDKHIPAGTSIVISPLHIGRSAQHFTEAERFRPERFVDDYIKPYSCIAFSAGPRNCIGQKFAMLEIKLIAVCIMRHFELSYAGDVNVEPVLVTGINLCTKNPLMFKLKERL